MDIGLINFTINIILIGIPSLLFLIDIVLKKFGKKGIWRDDE